MNDLTREECLRAIVRHCRGKVYEGNLRYFAKRELIVLTPLGEIVLEGRDPKEVYDNVFPKLRFVGNNKNQNH